MGRCPFHNEKTPSFTVNDHKQFYHCFGCGAHGDIFNFIMATEGINFIQALTQLADRSNVTIPKHHTIHYYQYEILNLAIRWFQHNLSDHPIALSYLKSRLLTKESIKIFEIGYAPPSGVKLYLQGQGIEENKIINTGLINGHSKEIFYSRIIFPIHDLNGRAIALGGRTLKDTQPKYLNSPETALFKKGENLYGLHLARNELTNNIIIVEGYLDVILLHQAGIKNVTSPLGTALTIVQSQHLLKLYDQVIVCLDGDEAGKNATLKIIELALSTQSSHKMKFILLPHGKDPYDIITQDDGLKIFKSFLQSAKAISETLWEILSKNIDLEQPEEKIKLKSEFSQYTSIIKEADTRKYYQQFFFKRLNTAQIFSNKKANSLSEINTNIGPILIQIILSYPDILNNTQAEEEFAKFTMETEQLRQVQEFIITTINNNEIDKISNDNLPNNLHNVITKILDHNYNVHSKDYAYSLWKRLMSLEEIKLLEQEYKNEIEFAINNNTSEDRANEILNHIMVLKSELKNTN